MKWAFKVKRDPTGAVVKHKARLVAKWYSQRLGVDFDEVFAPMVRMETVRLILALAVHSKWEVHNMDVKSMFLNGVLTEEVYVQQPPGFAIDKDAARSSSWTKHRTPFVKLRARGMPSSMRHFCR
jgi:hypothetical protein